MEPFYYENFNENYQSNFPFLCVNCTCTSLYWCSWFDVLLNCGYFVMELTKNQKLWIEALRSGKYKQTVGVLESTSGGFCCLGVACKVAEEHGVEVIYDKLGTIDGNHLDYQRAVQEWLGLINVDGFPSIYGSPFNLAAMNALTAMNDNGASFEEIADIIEQHPEWYFHETKN